MGSDFTKFHPYEADQILMRTTDEGPFNEDCFWVVVKGDQFWEVPNSAAYLMFDWLKDCDRIDWEQSILASCSIENAVFVLWRKDGSPVLSEKVKEDLRTRFDAFLTSHFELDRAERGATCILLMNHYSEPHRKYHTLQHIAHCLWELDRCAISHESKKLIELAIWFHDVIYQTKSKTNEADSADFLTRQLGHAKSDIDLDKVRSMILASQHLSGGSTSDTDTDLFLDIDLAILGQGRIDYDVYQRSVRAEYADVSAWRFNIGRKRVLKHFDKSQIFRTDAFRQKYEIPAHENLKEELSQTKYRWIFWE